MYCLCNQNEKGEKNFAGCYCAIGSLRYHPLGGVPRIYQMFLAKVVACKDRENH